MKGTAMRWLVVVLGLAAAPVAAQGLDVEFDVPRDGQAAGCASSEVKGLKAGGDGFLAVRSGPGGSYAELDRLHNGDVVAYCAKNGKWIGIVYGDPKRRGWVHGNWLVDLAG
jgi:hypothetical protein